MIDTLLLLIVVGVLMVAILVDLGMVAIWIARRIRARVTTGGDRRLKAAANEHHATLRASVPTR